MLKCNIIFISLYFLNENELGFVDSNLLARLACIKLFHYLNTRTFFDLLNVSLKHIDCGGVKTSLVIWCVRTRKGGESVMHIFSLASKDGHY